MKIIKTDRKEIVLLITNNTVAFHSDKCKIFNVKIANISSLTSPRDESLSWLMSLSNY